MYKTGIFDLRPQDVLGGKEGFVNYILNCCRPVCWVCKKYCNVSDGKDYTIVDKRSGARMRQFICNKCIKRVRGEKKNDN